MVEAVAVAEGLYRVDAPLGERFASLYVVVGSAAAMLYDTGVDGVIPQHIVPTLATMGIEPRDIRTVIVSHNDVDHFGGVADAREQFANARILAHALDRPSIEHFETYLGERARGFLADYGWDEDPAVLDWCRSVTRETALDGEVVDGDRIDLGDREVVIWHLPGHSHGSIGVEIPWADAILVSDAVLGASVNLADGTPAFPPTYRYVDEYLSTIARLDLAGHTRLLTAHYPPLEGKPAHRFLVESREFVGRLDELVIAALRAGPLTLAALLAELNPVAGDWPLEATAGALAFPVVGHLERGLARGTVRSAGEHEGVPVWSAA